MAKAALPPDEDVSVDFNTDDENLNGDFLMDDSPPYQEDPAADIIPPTAQAHIPPSLIPSEPAPIPQPSIPPAPQPNPGETKRVHPGFEAISMDEPSQKSSGRLLMRRTINKAADTAAPASSQPKAESPTPRTDTVDDTKVPQASEITSQLLPPPQIPPIPKKQHTPVVSEQKSDPSSSMTPTSFEMFAKLPPVPRPDEKKDTPLPFPVAQPEVRAPEPFIPPNPIEQEPFIPSEPSDPIPLVVETLPKTVHPRPQPIQSRRNSIRAQPLHQTQTVPGPQIPSHQRVQPALSHTQMPPVQAEPIVTQTMSQGQIPPALPIGTPMMSQQLPVSPLQQQPPSQVQSLPSQMQPLQPQVQPMPPQIQPQLQPPVQQLQPQVQPQLQPQVQPMPPQVQQFQPQVQQLQPQIQPVLSTQVPQVVAPVEAQQIPAPIAQTMVQTQPEPIIPQIMQPQVLLPPPSPTQSVERGFTSAIDRTFANFRRAFSKELSAMIRNPPPLDETVNVDEFTSDLTTAVGQLIEAPITPPDFNNQQLSRRLSAAIQEQTNQMTSVLADVDAQNTTAVEHHIAELRQLQDEVENLRIVFKTSTEGIIRELERERQNKVSMSTAEKARTRELEERMRRIRLKQVELETRANHQSAERENVDRLSKQVLQKRRQWEDEYLMEDDEGEGVRQRLLQAISTLKSDADQDSAGDIGRMVEEGLRAVKEESDNMRNELLSLEMANRWAMARLQQLQTARTSTPSPRRERQRSSVITEAQFKVNELRRQRENNIRGVTEGIHY